MKHIIHIYGASDSGTSTLGKKICEKLGYKFMDTDDYFWMPTNPPYTVKREKEERIRLMREDIKSADHVVISGSLVDWGDELIPLFTLVIRMETDMAVRIDRLKKREYDKWQQLLQCHQIVMNGANSLEENYQIVREEIQFTECIKKVEIFIRELFKDDASGHDDWHSIRVYQNACKISLTETCNWKIVALAALLHDADDEKLFQTSNYENARNIMNACAIPEKMQQQVIDIVSIVSFKGKETIIPDTMEGKIVQDADRLDAIGALGIARTFAFGGSRGRKIYDPGEIPKMDLSYEDYKSHEGTTINHFYEKLFLLKDLMNTETAKRIAEKREDFMKRFLDEFYKEWNGVC